MCTFQVNKYFYGRREAWFKMRRTRINKGRWLQSTLSHLPYPVPRLGPCWSLQISLYYLVIDLFSFFSFLFFSPFFLTHPPPCSGKGLGWYLYAVCLCVESLSRVWLCDHVDCSPPGSSVHGMLQARILEWVTMPSSRESSQFRDHTQVSCIAGEFFAVWAPREC